ncbi:MAG: hypothetical protein JNL39_10345 [Opitutaceae bacterium]|nr:hypothetical protein [Opitutaceae bacterium]
MSASKNTKSKPAKSPAPATKSTAPAKPVAKPKTAAPAKAAVSVKRAVPAVKLAPVTVKPVASKPVLTTIGARIDIGFGNALTIRGEGAGLSWDKGMAMDCVEADLWRITLPESAHGHTFKFLVNDLTWSTGPDYTVPAGGNVTLTPEF